MGIEGKLLKRLVFISSGGSTGLKAGVNKSAIGRYGCLPRLHVSQSCSVSALFHPHVLAQKRRHIEVLALHDCRFAFFEATAGDGLELQNFLFRRGSSLFALRVLPPLS